MAEGSPIKATKPQRQHVMGVRVTEEEARKVRDLAAYRGMSVSELFRKTVLLAD